ncbi:hypothetical protein [Halocatena marina]|uniref:Uncharacterized protein n=1 Tax=Halocatena marina TaxID=2934937 RepID=A0ABD5YTW8_9EURY|nr:hypothetical protein [Halocatena marina]
MPVDRETLLTWETGDRHGEAMTLDNLGKVAQKHGDLETAVELANGGQE